MNYSHELHTSYQKSIGAFTRVYPHMSATTAKDIDAFCRTCALVLWNAFHVEIDLCTEGINEIYSKEKDRRSFSEDDVAAAIHMLNSRKYSISVPTFFKEIISHDVKEGTCYSRKLATCLKLVLISFALIDGNVEYDEARHISLVYQTLIDECDKEKVMFFRDDTDPFSYVSESHTEPKPATFTNTRPSGNRKVPASPRKETKNSPFEELNSLIGLSNVKQEIKEISDFAAVQNARAERGLPTSEMSYHLVFTGNPGTGKTTVARLVAQIYKELGILSKGHLIEASAKDLVAGYVGQTATKTYDIICKAHGGVLFIDEAYALMDSTGQGYGHEAVDTLLKEMEDHRGDLAIIVAGYDDEMEQFINSNPGLKSRFNRFIHFEDYSAEEMLLIFKSLCKKNAYTLDPLAEKKVSDYLDYICANKTDGFANARTARNFFESVITKQAARISSVEDKTDALLSTICVEDIPWSVSNENKEETLDDVMRDLQDLVGLDAVKEEITELVYMVQHQQKRKAQGLKVPLLSLHLVFTGNPGTGKTTVARYVARIYRALGLLSTGQLVETDRSGLVAGYVGQTAIKTKSIIDSAIGGVLFIDEAYTLATSNNDDFGQECIDTLLKAMEDCRDNLAVIVAGYDDLMDSFIHSNPGLESRFNRYIHFDDYSAEQMMQIFRKLCESNQYTLNESADQYLQTYFAQVDAGEIANGRGVRNLFERIITRQAKRLSKEPDSNLSEITIADIAGATKR